MALTKNLLGLGMPPHLANALGFGGDPAEASGLVAAGTTSADALQLTTGINILATVASGAGVTLPAGVGMCAVINGGANAVLCYPGTGKQINNGTVTTGTYSVANGKTAIFITAGGARWIATLST